MPDYSPFDIIDFTVDERPADVASVFDDLIGQKIVDAIAQKKVEVAQQMFNPEDDDEESEDGDDEDFEFDEDELEDLDTEEEEDENS
jgi:hypothetical protein